MTRYNSSWRVRRDSLRRELQHLFRILQVSGNSLSSIIIVLPRLKHRKEMKYLKEEEITISKKYSYSAALCRTTKTESQTLQSSTISSLPLKTQNLPITPFLITPRLVSETRLPQPRWLSSRPSFKALTTALSNQLHSKEAKCQVPPSNSITSDWTATLSKERGLSRTTQPAHLEARISRHWIQTAIEGRSGLMSSIWGLTRRSTISINTILWAAMLSLQTILLTLPTWRVLSRELTHSFKAGWMKSFGYSHQIRRRWTLWITCQAVMALR